MKSASQDTTAARLASIETKIEEIRERAAQLALSQQNLEKVVAEGNRTDWSMLTGIALLGITVMTLVAAPLYYQNKSTEITVNQRGIILDRVESRLQQLEISERSGALVRETQIKAIQDVLGEVRTTGAVGVRERLAVIEERLKRLDDRHRVGADKE